MKSGTEIILVTTYTIQQSQDFLVNNLLLLKDKKLKEMEELKVELEEEISILDSFTTRCKTLDKKAVNYEIVQVAHDLLSRAKELHESHNSRHDYNPVGVTFTAADSETWLPPTDGSSVVGKITQTDKKGPGLSIFCALFFSYHCREACMCDGTVVCILCLSRGALISA